MDDEQRKYFSTLLSQMEGVASDARAAASTSRETAATVSKLDGRVGVLEKHVFGSDPPPAPNDPLFRQVSEHDGEIATLAGQIIAARGEVATVKAEVATVKGQNEEQLEILRTIAKALGNPMLRKVAYVVGTAILGYAATKGWLHQ